MWNTTKAQRISNTTVWSLVVADEDLQFQVSLRKLLTLGLQKFLGGYRFLLDID